MGNASFILCLILGCLISFGFLGFSAISYFEKEQRAARRALVLALLVLLLFSVPSFILPQLQLPFLESLGILFLICVFLFFTPFGRVTRIEESAASQIDERNIMFARYRLKPGSKEYESYYATKSETKLKDDATRAKPGLMGQKASLFHEPGASTAQACFEIPEALRDSVDGPVSSTKTDYDTSVISDYLKHTAQYFGARNVGICELRTEHIYSNIGRGTGTYGDPVSLNHRYAIAFTLEMDIDQVASGPQMPITMESARQYSNGAVIAVQLAALIRSLGYPARAHIDGNYRVVAPLVARDAGLGEIGRMGLLMAPDLGPRMRLGIVTTDMPLTTDSPGHDKAMLHFCEICKKCGDNCPSRSIPMGPREEINGVYRWQIDQESCFRYWCLVGTDCGKCMAVCPFSHPDNMAHNLVRWAIARSGFARHAALYLDDFFYGRKPVSKAIPNWIPDSTGSQNK